MRTCSDERGAAVVELAFVLPLLLLLVFGVIEFGRGYHAKVTLTGAVREGARAAALGQDPVKAVHAASPGLNPAPSVTVLASCPSPPPPGANAEVRAAYDVAYNVPFFRAGTWTVTAVGVMRCGL